MNWYWIVLIICVYMFIIGVCGAIFEKEGEDPVAGIGLGFIWPLWLVPYLGYVSFRKKKKK